MRLAMIGAGAMGAMFGARFARAGAEIVLYPMRLTLRQLQRLGFASRRQMSKST